MATNDQRTVRAGLFYILGISIVISSILINGLYAFLLEFRTVPKTHLDVNPNHLGRDAVPGESLENIFWFVQVTDLHISSHVRPGIVGDLVDWCKQMRSVVKPEFILATGDLTDAKARDQTSSSQIEQEWVNYKAARDACYGKQTNAADMHGKLPPWLDIRGNHDSFNVDLKVESGSQPWFDRYTASAHRDVSHFVVEKPFGRYAFIGIDFSPQPGPSRPLNFFGFYNFKRDRAQLDQFVELERQSNLTFFYGHHTLNVVTSSEQFFSSMKYGAVYLCGHLHALLNWKSTQRLYGYHRHLRDDSSLLELELADFQDNRRFRVIAVDHDLMSFSDGTYDKWPLIVITCPKHAQFVVAEKEPLHRMAQSTHIRMLIFSTNHIEDVKVEILSIGGRNENSVVLWEDDAKHAGGPLYVAAWNPASFSSGLYKMRVSAKDDAGETSILEQPFSLDGSAPKLPFLASLVISADMSKVAKVSFWTVHFSLLITLTALRFKSLYLRKIGVLGLPFLGGILHNMSLYVSYGNLFKPFFLYQLWIAYAPWFVGSLLTNRSAVVFVHGVLFLDGTFIPSGLNHFFALFHLVFLDIPMLIILSTLIGSSGRRRNQHSATFVPRSAKLMGSVKKQALVLLALILLIWQCHKSFELFLNYGLMAVCTNVVEFYNIFLYIYQTHFALHL